MKRILRLLPIIGLLLFSGVGGVPAARAGGGPANVLIVVNQASTNSVQLGNYYQEQRQVPPGNFLRVNWTGGNVQWSPADFTNVLLNPLLAALSARQLTNQIQYVFLSMDLPYRVSAPGLGDNATTCALFYGFQPDTNPPCSLALTSTNLYAAAELPFASVPPLAAPGTYFLTTLVTAGNLAQAKLIVDQGVRSDGAQPAQTVLLAKSSDYVRNIRFFAFDNTVFNTRLRGNYSVVRTNLDSPLGLTNLLGLETGLYLYDLSPGTFRPGALADSLTSFAGQLFENAGQTSQLIPLAAGAAGSYGTVTEPCNYPNKFPDPQNYFYQARGFNLAECYYQSVTNPYQGTIMGEPLAAPFALPGTGAWSALPANAPLVGRTNLALQFLAHDPQRPLQKVDLYVDGLWFQTLTNLAPAAGNQLGVQLGGRTVFYTVPPGATLAGVANGLTAALNAVAGATGMAAIAHGDRVELQATNTLAPGASLPVSVAVTTSGGVPLTTALFGSRPNFLDSIAWGLQGCFAGTNATPGAYLQLSVVKTNGATVLVGVTNAPGNTDFPAFFNQFVAAVNTSPALQGPDGVIVEDVQPFDYLGSLYFDLRARSPGLLAAQMQIALTGSPGLGTFPVGINLLNANAPDLFPRNHLYVAAGVTNLAFTFPLDTTQLADGYHTLTAVASEGTGVATQTRAPQTVVVHNHPLTATLASLVGGTNTALESTLQFNVAANPNNVTRLELFSTGGSLGAVVNQSSATFSVVATNLGLGLHPFYAVATGGAGTTYRTPTLWFRLVGLDSPFLLQVTNPIPTLVWPAAAGRSYDILTAPAANGPYTLRSSFTPTNSTALWRDPSPPPVRAFYRVRVTP